VKIAQYNFVRNQKEYNTTIEDITSRMMDEWVQKERYEKVAENESNVPIVTLLNMKHDFLKN